jgi:predicted permease
MFKNYLVIAARNLWKNRIFSLINIAGLSIGISASLVIYLIVHHEFSYEKFQVDGDRTYRVVTNMHFPDADFKNSGVPGPLPAAVRADIPGINNSTAFYIQDRAKVKVAVGGEKETVYKKQEHVIFADSLYFSFVPYRWLAGSPATALAGPNKVVLTESRAKLYFPGMSPAQVLGRTITYFDSLNAEVTGVVKDLDAITDFSFQEFLSFASFREQYQPGWGEWGSVSSSSQFLVKLKPGVDTSTVNRQLKLMREKHAKNAYLETDHFLQPLSDIHFNSDFDNFDQRIAHKPTLYGLLAVAAFLLLLGCINFINLTTAQGSKRAKEIGIRKTMGSSRLHLAVQFLTESMLLAVAATIVSLFLVPSILNIFSDFVPPGLDANPFRQPGIILFGIGLVLVVGLLAGVYPAIVLSKFKPVTVLKNVANANTAQSRRAWVRKTLTVSQFVIAQFFIIATLVVSKQIRFSLTRDLGFRKEAIVNFNAPFDYQHKDNRASVLLAKLKAIPGVSQISLAGPPPASPGGSSTTMKFNDGKKDVETTVEVKQADTNYFRLYNMRLVAGRNLNQSDTVTEYVINEAYARFLGYKDPTKIVGQFLGSEKLIPIVGVIADFHFKSMHKVITPLVFRCQQNDHHFFHLALPIAEKNTDKWSATLAKVGQAWKEVYPDEDFNYDFFDESIARFYAKEQQTGRLLNWSTGLAIIISCLGLLGLVIFTTTQRTKEIGVRKVLGASIVQIVALLSRDFVVLVLVGFAIAAPIAGWAMHRWLNDFAYRTSISWWIFAASGFAMVFVALATMGIQTFRAARSNPVKALRTE